MNNYEFAINMELEGVKYYEKQAELNKDNSLKTVFLILAKDEENHAKILEKKTRQLEYMLEDNQSLSKFNNVFDGNEDLKNEGGKTPNQLDAYKIAIKMEKESIDLYTKLLAETKDNNSKELFEYLVKQEAEHLDVIEELVRLIKHADEWVEDAEFGRREDY